MAHILTSKDDFYRRNLERIKRLRLLDDDFFRVCFQDDKEGAEFILRIILDKNDLTVVESKTQYSVKNLQGHSVILDVFATDSSGIRYNIEIQRADRGALPKRARYNSSLIDSHILPIAGEYDSLPETYVIFITENDVIGDGRLIYHIDRMITECGRAFGDGSHIVYVNAAREDDSALGKLMHDFNCVRPDDMNYASLRQRTAYFKENDKGVLQMCKIMEEIKQEGIEEGREEGREEGAEVTKRAIRMIKEGKLSVEEIAATTGLPEDEINELVELLND